MGAWSRAHGVNHAEEELRPRDSVYSHPDKPGRLPWRRPPPQTGGWEAGGNLIETGGGAPGLRADCCGRPERPPVLKMAAATRVTSPE
ncbi:hypothetical protein NDU88_008486 [Pleurodeles waltl]|uniref:Uncharacterized protein n=1 Tax=Pleurodeles waltl TaxID=8319 RepID=A0AAV7NWD4_PLEWA|nr:hypothetical protein NDU88_008486 [Pleurodeles waltl]